MPVHAPNNDIFIISLNNFYKLGLKLLIFICDAIEINTFCVLQIIRNIKQCTTFYTLCGSVSIVITWEITISKRDIILESSFSDTNNIKTMSKLVKKSPKLNTTYKGHQRTLVAKESRLFLRGIGLFLMSKDIECQQRDVIRDTDISMFIL